MNGPLKSNKICDVKATPLDRAKALVAAMTQQEKLANLVRYVTRTNPTYVTKKMYSKSPGVSRLGLPAYNWWGEALHGVAGAPGIDFSGDFKTATSFPMPILMSAAFDDNLIEQVATIIGTEARAFGNGGKAPFDFWTPNINPYKDPRWGRGSETPGEDAFRLKGYVKHLLLGLEGTDPKERRIVATCKHYAANDLEDWKGTNRHNFDAKISQQGLFECKKSFVDELLIIFQQTWPSTIFSPSSNALETLRLDRSCAPTTVSTVSQHVPTVFS